MKIVLTGASGYLDVNDIAHVEAAYGRDETVLVVVERFINTHPILSKVSKDFCVLPD